MADGLKTCQTTMGYEVIIQVTSSPKLWFGGPNTIAKDIITYNNDPKQ
jgi:hypothetical protein